MKGRLMLTKSTVPPCSTGSICDTRRKPPVRISGIDPSSGLINLAASRL